MKLVYVEKEDLTSFGIDYDSYHEDIWRHSEDSLQPGADKSYHKRRWRAWKMGQKHSLNPQMTIAEVVDVIVTYPHWIAMDALKALDHYLTIHNDRSIRVVSEMTKLAVYKKFGVVEMFCDNGCHYPKTHKIIWLAHERWDSFNAFGPDAMKDQIIDCVDVKTILDCILRHPREAASKAYLLFKQHLFSNNKDLHDQYEEELGMAWQLVLVKDWEPPTKAVSLNSLSIDMGTFLEPAKPAKVKEHLGLHIFEDGDAEYAEELHESIWVYYREENQWCIHEYGSEFMDSGVPFENVVDYLEAYPVDVAVRSLRSILEAKKIVGWTIDTKYLQEKLSALEIVREEHKRPDVVAFEENGDDIVCRDNRRGWYLWGTEGEEEVIVYTPWEGGDSRTCDVSDLDSALGILSLYPADVALEAIRLFNEWLDWNNDEIAVFEKFRKEITRRMENAAKLKTLDEYTKKNEVYDVKNIINALIQGHASGEI